MFSFGHLYFSTLLISWKLRIRIVLSSYLVNLDGAVRLRCLFITMFPQWTLLFINWFRLRSSSNSLVHNKLFASDIYFQSDLFKRWRKLLYWLYMLFVPFFIFSLYCMFIFHGLCLSACCCNKVKLKDTQPLTSCRPTCQLIFFIRTKHIIHHSFTPSLKHTFLQKSFSPQLPRTVQTAFTDHWTGFGFFLSSVFVIFFSFSVIWSSFSPLIFCLIPFCRLTSCVFVWFWAHVKDIISETDHCRRGY